MNMKSIGAIIGIYLVMFSGFVALSSAAAAADEVKDWYRAVAVKVAKKHVYPRSALSREIEGRALVHITVDRTGKIVTYEITKPTGQSVLDKAIPKMIRRISPLPKPPASITESQLQFVIPISWSMP
ncbi:MAG: hypothetical protein COB37_05040 [Kordiimonadales bacterium]|nr:MAG: hypothetical protein COB37_05040 [Kordiimonadales bacterium]